jgi:hypothetical protein
MKKYYIILVALLLVNVAMAQSCLPNGILFTRQSQIDSFQINYPNCAKIEGDVEIEGSDITNLNGLNVITSIGGGDLYILANNALTSLTGLNNIDAGSITSLTIYFNSSLSTCAVQSICDYLVSPNGFTGIMGNAPGCNSELEVREACAAMGMESVNPELSLIIYPDPTSSGITIKTPIHGHFSIFNFSGQQLLQQEITEPSTSVDVSTLPSGIYGVKAVGEKGVLVGKFVKE